MISSEIFRKNLHLFAQCNPGVTVDANAVDLTSVLNRFSVEDLQKGGLRLFEAGRLIDSTEENFLEQLPVPLQQARVAFLEGFGVGTTLAWTIRTMGTRLKKIVVVEPDVSRFYQALALTDFEELFGDSRIIWMVGYNKDKFFARCYEAFRLPPTSLYMDAYTFIRHPGLSVSELSYFDEIRDEWNAANRQIRRNYGGREDALLGLKNTFENLDWVKKTPGVAALKDAFLDKPAIVVAAGPSLQRSLPMLRKLQNKAILISSDATLSLLLEEGIEPHFVVTMERGRSSKRFFDAVGSRAPRTELIAYPLVDREVLDSFYGNQWCAWRDYASHYYLSKFLPRGQVRTSSSVSHFAMRLADLMGCSTVALVGQDLAYDPHTFQSHVGGIAYDEWGQPSSPEEIQKRLLQKDEGQLFWVPGNIDETVPTNSTYFSFMKEYSWESQVSRCQIINCTEGGAKIPNITWSRLEYLSSDWVDIPDVFEVIQTKRQPAEGDFSWEALRAELASIRPRIVSLSEQCKAMAQETQVPAEVHNKMMELIEKSKKGLEDMVSFYCFVVETNAREYLDIENELAKLSNFSFRDCAIRYTLVAQWFDSMQATLDAVLALMPCDNSTQTH